MLSLQKAFEAVHEIGLQASETRGVTAFAQDVADVLDRHIEWEHGAVLLLGADGRLEPVGLSRPDGGPRALAEDRRFVREKMSLSRQGLTGWVAEHGRSVCLADVREDSRYFALRDDIRSELCVPIRIGGWTLGVLNTESTRSGAYTPRHQHLLEIVAVEVAAVIRAQPRSLVLQGTSQPMVTLCSSCKRFKAADGSWGAVEALLNRAAGLEVSHGICEACLPNMSE